MNLNAGRYALGVCVAVTMLAGCANATQSSLTLPLSTSSAHATVEHWSRPVRHASVTETILYSFGRQGDGADPDAGLTYSNGTLYGTTAYGGTGGCTFGSESLGCGTVFGITPSGTETVLYSFMGGLDGAFPNADLINVGGTFYGTTFEAGGTGCGGLGCGTVFSVTPSGAEAVLHGFTGQPDGWQPGGLLNVNGTMYGTTYGGGAGHGLGRGTIYSITPSGTETVVYTFRTYSRGGNPYGPLLKLGRKFYGTTEEGGISNHCCGTVFSLNPSNHQAVVYRFQGGSTDGAYPNGGLIDVNGTLYGTTSNGAGTGCEGLGCGTVFSVTPSGTETVIHQFTGEPDGELPPNAPLLNVNGTMYGTTPRGGTYNYGTVYSITPSGTETVLYSFKGSPNDGELPASGLTYANGTLYGTTRGGGAFCVTAYCDLGGTVFSITL